jgi:hypothetical protein
MLVRSLERRKERRKCFCSHKTTQLSTGSDRELTKRRRIYLLRHLRFERHLVGGDSVKQFLFPSLKT